MADDNDVEIRFGAAIDDFTKGVNSLKSEMAGLAEQTRSQLDAPLREMAEVNSQQLQALTHTMRGFAEQVAMGISPVQALGSEMAHLSFLAGTEGGLAGAFKNLGAAFEPMLTTGNLFAVGLIGAGVAASELFSRISGPSAEEAEKALQANKDLIDQIAAAFPEAAREAKSYQAALEQLPQIVALSELQDQIRKTDDQLSAARDQVTGFWQTLTASGAGDQILGNANSQVQDLLMRFAEGKMTAAELQNALAQMKLDGALKGDTSEFVQKLTEAVDTAAKLETSLGGVRDMMANVAAEGDVVSQDFAALKGVSDVISKFRDMSEGLKSAKDRAKDLFDKSITNATSAEQMQQLTAAYQQYLKVLDQHDAAKGAHSASTDAADAARAKYDGEVSAMQSALTRKQELLDAELQMHQISEQDWVRQSQAAVDAEFEQERAELQRELQLGNLKLTQRQEILNKLRLIEEKHSSEIAKIQLKAATDAAKAWQGYADEISSAINGQLNGLLKGTESISQALENIGLSLVSELAESAIKSIVTSAAQAFAGVFAFLAPTMGPAAAGPAAASQASVMAVASAIPSLDVGTWSVPRDMMANIHQGETVMPAFEAGQFRDAMSALAGGAAQQRQSGTGGGGGPTFNFNGPVFDKDGLARMIAKLWDANPSLRPKY